ncbi:hypothetical protein [Niastella populi]|uniref:Uncharacterized protein n=1 Tax=Niastella populi TaxID=550983 RepID=A0A1V9ESG6_9BACT|nr:hypothetical protein [Niastella populi]OQP49066.1 hypothetical protein A4R26_31115 [Niastella populi]
MKIESAVYRAIYKCLCDKIEEDYYKGKPHKFKSENRAELFEKRKDGKIIGMRLLEGVGTLKNPKYFYRRFTELNPDTIRGEINPIALYNILFELGYKLNEKYVEPKPNKDESVPISKAQNLLDQFISMHPADIREEQNRVEKCYYIYLPEGKENEALEVSQSTFDEIQRHYNDIPVELFNEKLIFEEWVSMVKRRFQSFEKVPDPNDIKSQLAIVKTFFQKSLWELFERSEEKITKRVIKFDERLSWNSNKSEDNKFLTFMTLVDFILDERHQKETASFEYDLVSNVVTLTTIQNSKAYGVPLELVVYNFAPLIGKPLTDFMHGSSIHIDSHTFEIRAKLALLVKVHDTSIENYETKYAEYDSDSSEIPLFIRSYLNAPSQDFKRSSYKNLLSMMALLLK